MNGPLQSYIAGHYRPLFTQGDIHFLVPQASKAVPFGQFELLVTAAGKETPPFPVLLRSNVVLTGQPVLVQLREKQFPWDIHETYSPTKSRILLEPINTQGELTGPPVELPLSSPLSGLFRLSIYTPHQPELTRPGNFVLQTLDSAGAVLSESID